MQKNATTKDQLHGAHQARTRGTLTILYHTGQVMEGYGNQLKMTVQLHNKGTPPVELIFVNHAMYKYSSSIVVAPPN